MSSSVEAGAFSRDARAVSIGEYEIKPPLVKPSRLTRVEKGGVGKELSDGWAVNFAVGCTHACPFCYADSINRRFAPSRFGNVARNEWGMYLLTPANIEEAIEETPWEKWRGELVMMSSMHDPYLPQLYPIPRKILERALPAGVRFLIQTRSALFVKDLDLLARYGEQIILQVSIATMSEWLAGAIEPRAPRPESRLRALKKAKEAGLKVGAIVAPVMPPNPLRENVEEDLERLMKALADVGADQVFGEMLHVRGGNMKRLERILGARVEVRADEERALASLFYAALERHGLKGEWWFESPRLLSLGAHVIHGL